jgi:threonine dehydrogenase-like Zn-dependent dehydrogenase
MEPKMRAVTWHGKKDVRVEQVTDPSVVNPRDAVVKVSLTAICGSDLHLYDGVIPTMEPGDVLGHEFMGEVVAVGRDVHNLSEGDRVVVPFAISCGRCWYCRQELWSLCDNSNPNASVAEAVYGQSGAGLFGYSHMFGGYWGGQAEYVRVPYADTGPMKVPRDIPDEKLLFLTDIFPTGYQAAQACELREGDTVAVWGCGPVGQFAIRSALMMGAHVIAIDHVAGRLRMAAAAGNGDITTLNFDEESIYEQVMDLTGGNGPDACIDAVGLESHGSSVDAVYDFVKTSARLATDRIHALRQAARVVRKGGTISIPGVYGGFADKFPIGAIFGKALTIRTGQTHVHRYLRPLLQHIRDGRIDPSFVITHRLSLDDAAHGYETFKNDPDECIKVVLQP